MSGADSISFLGGLQKLVRSHTESLGERVDRFQTGRLKPALQFGDEDPVKVAPLGKFFLTQACIETSLPQRTPKSLPK